ncbi:hypothetical protein HDE_13216 [Halotydeus destructor]|nr:hypothetical protein HDE_13216 [Halotydeus destructor]
MRIIDTPLNELKVVHDEYLYCCSLTRTNQNGDTYKLMTCAQWGCSAKISLKKILNQCEWKIRHQNPIESHNHPPPDPIRLAEQERKFKIIETSSSQMKVVYDGYLFDCSYTCERDNGDTYKLMRCVNRRCSASVSLKRKLNRTEWKLHLLKLPIKHWHSPPGKVRLAALERRHMEERRLSMKKLRLRLQSLNEEQNLSASIETKLQIVISQLKAKRDSLESQVQKLEIGRHDSLQCVRDNVINKLSEVSNLFCGRSSVLDCAEQIMRSKAVAILKLPSTFYIDAYTQTDGDVLHHLN